jgi:hypothetical protein
MNRMHETVPGARVEGSVLLDGWDIYGTRSSAVGVRRMVGMVFQRPNPFPTMSIRDNVVAGLKLQGTRNKKSLDELAERSLRGASLWNEVKDRLDRPGGGLWISSCLSNWEEVGHRHAKGLRERVKRGVAVAGGYGHGFEQSPDLLDAGGGKMNSASPGIRNGPCLVSQAAGSDAVSAVGPRSRECGPHVRPLC